jgi:DNA polymerase III delta subunit
VTPAELNKELSMDRFRSVYYFYGSEEYRIKEAGKAVIRKFLPKAQQQMNHTVISAAKTKIEDILTELSIFPMLGERQIFTINDIQSSTPQNVEKILKLLDPPDSSRIVILIAAPAKTPRKNSKLFKLLTSNTNAVEFGRVTQNAARNRLHAIFHNNEISIEADALDMLVMTAGGDLGGLILEANKLIDYTGAGGTIKKEDVLAVSSDYQVFKIYELTDQMALRNVDKALEIIGFLHKKGETFSTMIFWIAEHFIDLYLLQNKKSIGAGKRNLEWKYKKQFGLFSSEQLEYIISLISKADTAIRSNLKPENVIMDKLIIEICSLDR